MPVAVCKDNTLEMAGTSVKVTKWPADMSGTAVNSWREMTQRQA